MELDNSKKNQENAKRWGGRRINSGRPLHSKNPATIEREEAARLFKERVAKNADKLFNAQLSLATGMQMLFVIHTDSKGKRRKPEIVTDVDTISRFLDENEGTDGIMEMKAHANDSKVEDYFFLTTSAPNNQALEGLLNRSFGKAEEKVDLSNKDGSLNQVHDISDEELNERINRILKV